MYILGVAQYTYQTVWFTGKVPNGSDHPYPLGVGIWSEKIIISSFEMHLAKGASNFLIVFSWDVPVTMQHGVCQQMSLF